MSDWIPATSWVRGRVYDGLRFEKTDVNEMALHLMDEECDTTDTSVYLDCASAGLLAARLWAFALTGEVGDV